MHFNDQVLAGGILQSHGDVSKIPDNFPETEAAASHRSLAINSYI